MVELNKKCLDIMAHLRKEQDYVTIDQLSQHFGISSRGVRYNIDKIEQYLVRNGFAYLERERLLGVRLPQQIQLYQFIDSCAQTLVPYEYNYSGAERQAFIIAAILCGGEPVKLEYFCKCLNRARNTALKDLDESELWLSQRDMQLIRRPRVGFYAEGSELQRRRCLTEILRDTIPQEELLSYMQEGTAIGKVAPLLLGELFTPTTMLLAAQSVKKTEQLLQKQFSDETFVNLALHLAIMLVRIGASGPQRLIVADRENIAKASEYSTAKVVLAQLETQTGLQFSVEELGYFTKNLRGARVIAQGPPTPDTQGDTQLMRVAQHMLEDIEKIYDVDFAAQKEDITRSLFVHLKPTVYRIRYGLYNKNPLYNEIVSNYNGLFINTRIACQHLENFLNSAVNDHEVAYIALHFGAALHRINKRTNHKARVLLVCGTGLGSARMITSQIQKMFTVEVVDTVSGRAAVEMDKSEIDYIISTISVPELEGEQYIKVSPLFTSKDQERLGQFLTFRHTPKERYDHEVGIANRLIAIVEKYCVVSDKIHLQYEFLNELMNQDVISTQPKGDYQLCDILRKGLIVPKVSCATWQDAIMAGAAPLEQSGIVEPWYKDAIIHNLNEFGPYMVMLPGMVLSHAGPEEGVNGLAMSLITLQEPVNFGHPQHDPVHIVITLCAKDQEKHLTALTQLFRMLKNTKEFARIAQSTDPSEIYQVIEEHSH